MIFTKIDQKAEHILNPINEKSEKLQKTWNIGIKLSIQIIPFFEFDIK